MGESGPNWHSWEKWHTTYTDETVVVCRYLLIYYRTGSHMVIFSYFGVMFIGQLETRNVQNYFEDFVFSVFLQHIKIERVARYWCLTVDCWSRYMYSNSQQSRTNNALRHRSSTCRDNFSVRVSSSPTYLAHHWTKTPIIRVKRRPVLMTKKKPREALNTTPLQYCMHLHKPKATVWRPSGLAQNF